MTPLYCTLQEVYWRIPASISPDQLNAAATALKRPGGVASLEAGSEVESESEGEPSDPGHMTNGQRHLTNGDDVMQSSSEGSDSERELTKAEVLAALRRSKGKVDSASRSSSPPSSLNKNKEKPNGECKGH